MFFWLNPFYVIYGLFRRLDSGRPFIKCTDSGVRFIEAKSSKCLDDFLEDIKKDSSLLRLLFLNQTSSMLGADQWPIIFLKTSHPAQ
ncbi:hypothetical protein RJ641_004767 [Dillenia turbinata]|uniref:Uncharacterized protein n=1 Tax=Dillenia turbinata TaxID=194707 RepID=A0AAN8VN10_9MAGN